MQLLQRTPSSSFSDVLELGSSKETTPTKIAPRQQKCTMKPRQYCTKVACLHSDDTTVYWQLNASNRGHVLCSTYMEYDVHSLLTKMNERLLLTWTETIFGRRASICHEVLLLSIWIDNFRSGPGRDK